MPEIIAMTPPDINGDQVFWSTQDSTDQALYLPPASDTSDLITEILNLPVELIEQEELIGVGMIEANIEAGAVYRIGSFAVKVMPSIAHGRALSCLRSNIILGEAFRVSGEGASMEIGGLNHRLITPQYLGMRSMAWPGKEFNLRDPEPSTSVLVMSDESPGRVYVEGSDFYDLVPSLEDSFKKCMDTTYPKGTVYLQEDFNDGNLLVGENDAVVLDVNGCNPWEF